MQSGPAPFVTSTTDVALAPRMLTCPASAVGDASHAVCGSSAVAAAGVNPCREPFIEYQVCATSSASVSVTSALVSVALSIAATFWSTGGGRCRVKSE